ncbi:hypothetical protein [Streptomyces sp. AC550_RSS872]|uniref:hypothetical protein n=1 Tax=Streptomyces sp. AC550_RSS872 TaxID=2823689 RepID=UPI001C276C08|nr:hypothetical protein [Streptomyces sp. AC550_RSS872]
MAFATTLVILGIRDFVVMGVRDFVVMGVRDFVVMGARRRRQLPRTFSDFPSPPHRSRHCRRTQRRRSGRG